MADQPSLEVVAKVCKLEQAGRPEELLAVEHLDLLMAQMLVQEPEPLELLDT